MRKLILMLTVFVFVATVAYAAPDIVGKLDAGVNVSAAISTDSDLDSTVYVGGTLAYGVTPWLAIGAESGWMSQGSELDLGNGIKADAGDLTGIPVFGDIILRVPLKDTQVVPYAEVGLGAIFWDFSESDLFNSANIQVDVDTSFAVKVGGGLDWFVNDNWILNFEAAYVFADADVTARVGGVTATDTSSVDYWTIGGGVKYLFG